MQEAALHSFNRGDKDCRNPIIWPIEVRPKVVTKVGVWLVPAKTRRRFENQSANGHSEHKECQRGQSFSIGFAILVVLLA